MFNFTSINDVLELAKCVGKVGLNNALESTHVSKQDKEYIHRAYDFANANEIGLKSFNDGNIEYVEVLRLGESNIAICNFADSEVVRTGYGAYTCKAVEHFKDNQDKAKEVVKTIQRIINFKKVLG